MKILLSLALAASAATASAAPHQIDGANVLKHITALASDEFEGRAPGTRGETLTIAYLQDEFRKLGLLPGNPDGTFLQTVPLLHLQSVPAVGYTVAGKATPLAFPDDVVAWSMRADKRVAVANSELVFVGYGVAAPEFKWDDYKGVDLRGKTLVMLINDPPLPDPKRRGQLDAAAFGGAAMTWYGRWAYKFDIAARLGAAGALIVHETKPAGYPWDVVRNSWARSNYGVKHKGDTPGYPAVNGWLRLESAKALFKAGGHDFDALKKAALSRDFKPVPLGALANITVANGWNETASHNVVAKIEGSDPGLKDEYVVYTAHWDHFGIDESLPGPRGRQIFHGAVDNASGVAALLEIARAYKALPKAPRRSVLFLLTTAEERGLLGAQYYVRHPLYPLAKTVLNINVDGLNLWGRTRDVELAGHGKSTADALVEAAAKRQGRVARPEGNPEAGAFYRSDQFEFARAGVPVVYMLAGRDYIGKPQGYGAGRQDQYTAQHYHTVNDVVQPGWDMAGAAQDIALLYQAGYQAAQDAAAPRWLPGAEFKGVREAPPAK
ncbi:M20/M25/M40 family metallo-hydrolase [Pseudoduganella namucuonensis]|uniref:Zn-dependent amino-or carboxypeptidase, M28 family n=1 Tax=Pseudoduganella namucuonensis TaxID=1035707 RepID=A0A1I7LV77_9BURK|nr:M20/M25/M40 family metallo-hydrolase [Pseudoduganella namucuonensis]SFV13559.1 Zn-dependent amino-or carboxypeptidase, M28 family [Pseudoduganella namucuonensis]